MGVHEYPHDNMVVWNERGFAMCMAKGYGTRSKVEMHINTQNLSTDYVQIIGPKIFSC